MSGKGWLGGGNLNIVVANKRESGKWDGYYCITGRYLWDMSQFCQDKIDSLDPVVYHHLKFLNCPTDVDGGLQTSWRGCVTSTQNKIIIVGTKVMTGGYQAKSACKGKIK